MVLIMLVCFIKWLDFVSWVTEWLRLEGTDEGHFVQPHLLMPGHLGPVVLGHAQTSSSYL